MTPAFSRMSRQKKASNQSLCTARRRVPGTCLSAVSSLVNGCCLNIVWPSDGLEDGTGVTASTSAALVEGTRPPGKLASLVSRARCWKSALNQAWDFGVGGIMSTSKWPCCTASRRFSRFRATCWTTTWHCRFSCISVARSKLLAAPFILAMPFTNCSAEILSVPPQRRSKSTSGSWQKRLVSTSMAESQVRTSGSLKMALNSCRSRMPLPSPSATAKSWPIFRM
mmetsp:Transcript_79582/g.257787  ORF Transcript_79582/g.257787 Transcript_79582/m.257787 type:complete len:225 (-) Transcript_79582:1370-2044(-)